MGPQIRSARTLVAAGALLAAACLTLACTGGSAGPPLDDSTLRASDPEAIGRRLLDRLATTIELQSPSVEVALRGGQPYALRFDYFSSMGDKSFLVHLITAIEAGMDRDPQLPLFE